MCDKSLRGVQELQQILRTASKDGIDKEVMDAKLAHMDEKLTELKEDIIKSNEKHKKELKLKDKEIRKGKETQRMLEEKLEQSKTKGKHGDPSKNRHQHQFASGDKDDSEHLADKYALEREVRKKREAQQKVRDCKREIQELQQKLAEKERQNQRLREDLQINQLLLQQFTNQKSQNSSMQQKGSDFDEEESNQNQNQLHFFKNGTQMMDLSEGRGYQRVNEEESQPRKLSQDKETDDQQSQSDSYYEKMITHAAEQEQIEAPSLKQLQSMETQASSQIQKSQQIQPSPMNLQEKVPQLQPQVKAEISATNKESDQTGTDSPVKSKSWSIWQYWFKKSK